MKRPDISLAVVLNAFLCTISVMADVIVSAPSTLLIGDTTYTVATKLGLTDGNTGTSATVIATGYNNGLGYDFSGFTTVSSIDVWQDSSASKRLQNVTMYYTGGSESFSLPNQDHVTITLSQPVQTAFIYMAGGATSQGDSGYFAPAIAEFNVTTNGTLQPRTNWAIGTGNPTIAGWAQIYGSAGPGVLKDSLMNGVQGDNQPVVWFDGVPAVGNNYVRYNLGQQRLIGGIGLDQAVGDWTAGSRYLLGSVQVQFSNDGTFTDMAGSTQTFAIPLAGYEQLTLAPVTAQYVAVIGIGKVLSPNNTWPSMGLREVQIFDATVAPEPASLSLLALGGLALLRRRSNQNLAAEQ